MKGIQTQLSMAMMLVRAIQGSVKKAGCSHPRDLSEGGERPEAVFHDRLADHPADRDRAQHEGQQESDAEELAGADVGVQQQREAEGDHILDSHRRDIEHHVAERVPEIGVAPQRAQISEPVEMMARLRVEVPVGEGDVEAEQRRKDHHRAGEQERRQHEQPLSPDFAVFENLADPERDAPDEEGVERRTPIGEADRHEAERVRKLEPGDDDKQRRGQPEQPAPEGRLAGQDIFVRRFELPASHSFMSVSAIMMQATAASGLGSVRGESRRGSERTITKRAEALRSGPSRCDST